MPINTHRTSSLMHRGSLLLAAILVLLPLQVWAQSIPADGLVAYYDFDDGTATDISLNGHHGTIIDAVSVPSPMGSGLLFDGDGDYVNITDGLDDLAYSDQSATLSCWVTIVDNDDIGETFVTLGNISDDVQGHVLSLAKSRSGAHEGRFFATLGFSDGSSDKQSFSSLTGSALLKNHWYHLVLVLNWESQTIELYVDGVPQGATGLNGVHFDLGGHGTPDFVMGTWNGQASWHNSNLDEVGLWDRALTPQEVIDLYEATRNTVRAWWDFSEASGTILNDISHNGNDGEIVGAVWNEEFGRTALQFNRDNEDHVVTTMTPRYDLQDDFTWEVVARFDSSSPSPQAFFGLEASNNAEIKIAVTDLQQGVTDVFASARGDNYSSTHLLYGQQEMAGTGWHSYALVRDTGSAEYRFYVDRALVQTLPQTDSTMLNGGLIPLSLGAQSHNDYVDWHFNGLLSEARISDVVLAPVEMLDPTSYAVFEDEASFLAAAGSVHTLDFDNTDAGPINGDEYPLITITTEASSPDDIGDTQASYYSAPHSLTAYPFDTEVIPGTPAEPTLLVVPQSPSGFWEAERIAFAGNIQFDLAEPVEAFGAYVNQYAVTAPVILDFYDEEGLVRATRSVDANTAYVGVLADGFLISKVRVYPDPGNSIGCFVMDNVSYTMNAETVQASFTQDVVSGVAPLTVAFSSTSTGTINSHHWDFGDGGFSEEMNPSHTFASGLYTVTLTVTGPLGSETATSTVTVFGEAPVVTAVSDVPDDQGGRVFLDCLRSSHDTGILRVEMYAVQRLDESGWVNVGAGIAYGEESYRFEITTRADSTAQDPAVTMFRVIAGMDEGNWASNEASGYSVDNLAPTLPGTMAAGLNWDFMTADLVWDACPDEDLGYYEVYRCADFESVPEPEWEVFQVVANELSLAFDEVSQNHQYRVAAIDVHGNRSELLAPPAISGAPVTGAQILRLGQNHPNPFNPMTTIRFEMAQPGEVELVVYGLDGRKVITLVHDSLAPGSHEVVWAGKDATGRQVASGTYLYRLKHGDQVQTRRMTLVK